MYLEHYNLRQIPFRNTPDPAFYFETPRHKEALANLIYAVEQRRGFVLLSGEIGSGKTLVTHMLVRHVEEHAQLALIRNTHLSSAQLIRLVCDEFSIPVSEHNDKASMLMAFNQFLIQQLAQDRLVVIIIDEAQNLSDKVLEELRMLSNLETSSEKLVQIVLVGQPELRDKVSQPHLEQLRQRVALTYHLDPLTPEEVAGYIEHRLNVAAGGGGGEPHKVVFTPQAIAKIARFSRGTPRIINGLCDNALLYGFSAQTTTIDERLIDKVIKHSMHLAPRSHMPPRSPMETTPVVSPQPRPPRPPTPVVSTTAQAPVPMPVSEEAAAPAALNQDSPDNSAAPLEEEDKKKAPLPPPNIPFPTLRQQNVMDRSP